MIHTTRPRATVAVPQYVPVSVTLRDPNGDGTLPVKCIYITVRVPKQDTIVETLFQARLLARDLGLRPIGTALVDRWEA